MAAVAKVRSCPSGGSARLITVGRLEFAKGAGRVIDALPLLLPHYPAITLDVVGDGSAAGAFRRKVESLGIQERVTFHGNVCHQTVLELLDRSDLLCFPTTASDGFPKAVLEALACGLPVVATAVSVLPLLLTSGCGILIPFPAGDSRQMPVEQNLPVQAVAGAIAGALSDPRRYEQMSRAALATARRFDLDSWRDTIGRHLAEAWGPLRG